MKTALQDRGILVDGEVHDFTANPYNYDDLEDSSLNTDTRLSDNDRCSQKEADKAEVSFWPTTEENGDDTRSDSDDEILTASELLKRQMGQHDLLGYISRKESQISSSLSDRNSNTDGKISQFKDEPAELVLSESENEMEITKRADSSKEHLRYLDLESSTDENNQSGHRNTKIISTSQLSDPNTISEENSHCDMRNGEKSAHSRQGNSCSNFSSGDSQYITSQDIISSLSQNIHRMENEGAYNSGSKRDFGDFDDANVSSNNALSRKFKPHAINSTANATASDRLKAVEIGNNDNNLQNNTETSILNQEEPILQSKGDTACDKAVEKLRFITQPRITKLNLDISSLISYISNLCHGHANYVFKEPILSEQAAQERMNPVLPILDKCFEGNSSLYRKDVLTTKFLGEKQNDQFVRPQPCGKIVKTNECVIRKAWQVQFSPRHAYTRVKS